jgi:hypothetical protein
MMTNGRNVSGACWSEDSVRKLVLLGVAITLIALLFGQRVVTPEDESSTSDLRGDTAAVEDLSDAGAGDVDGEGRHADEPALVRSHPISRGSKAEGHAYEEAVDSFEDSYRDTIYETNLLVHALVVESKGDGRLTEGEAKDLYAHLSDMEVAYESEAVEGYPEGYEECGQKLRVAAVSLDLAADSIRRFYATADAEYLKDYQALIGMYLQAVADAESCVSAHLYPASP